MSLAVENDRLVTLSVRMADMSGKILEETGPEGLTYLHGHGDILPKLEKALEGRFEGEGFFIKLEPEEAFGEYDDEAIRMVPASQLGEPDVIVPGLTFEEIPGEQPDGRMWRVTDVAEGMAVLEANHPLAGIALQFEIRVLHIEEVDDPEALSEETAIVPSFLTFADKIVNEDFDEEDDEAYERQLAEHHHHEDDTPMGRMAGRPPRIIR